MALSTLASALEMQQIFKSMFNALINEKYYVPVYVSSKLKWNVERTVGYNNEILIISKGVKTGSHTDVSKAKVYHQNSAKLQLEKI